MLWWYDYGPSIIATIVVGAGCLAALVVTDDYSVREQTNISPEEDTRLTEAEKAFRNLGAEMRAFANGDRLAYLIVRSSLGYDADQIAGALIAYSNNISMYGQARFDALKRLERLLRIRAESA